MDQAVKKRLLIALVALAFISSAALLVRYYFFPSADLSDEARADLGAVRVESYDPDNLPPQGDMTDQEYMLMLYRLREEAAGGDDVEPGSAQKPVKP